MTKTTVHQRIEQLAAGLGLNNFGLSKALGVSSTQIYNIINGRNAPSFDLLTKIVVSFPTVNIVWILTGEGAMFGASPEQIKESLSVMDKIKYLEQKIQALSENKAKKENVSGGRKTAKASK
jgi:DNA-binding XRE family transcriptional regulator